MDNAVSSPRGSSVRLRGKAPLAPPHSLLRPQRLTSLRRCGARAGRLHQRPHGEFCNLSFILWRFVTAAFQYVFFSFTAGQSH